MAAPQKPNMKLVVLGEVNAGKTQLVRRYLGEEFEANSEPTLGFNAYRKTLSNGHRLAIYDQAGNEQHLDQIDRRVLQTAAGILLVFDLSDCDLNLTRRWMDIARARTLPHTPIVLVGNKSDLQRNIERATIENIVDELGAFDYLETSALTGSNVGAIFDRLLDAVHERKRNIEAERRRKEEADRREKKEKQRKEREKAWSYVKDFVEVAAFAVPIGFFIAKKFF